jgi:glycosyltransferase involved in cell wall biosynthesis
MLMLNNKKRVLFVGSFKVNAKDGSVGGQMYACRSLIDSELSNFVDWILLDSTADSNLEKSFIKRTYKACKRLLKFIYYLITSNIDFVIIFTADGWSFIEKGTMALIAKFFRKRVILAPRSGLVVNDIKESNFMKKFIPFILKHVDYIICQGQIWKLFYSNLVKKNLNKFIVINNWIDVSKYSSTSKSNDCIQILYLSWVDKNKGIIDLINSLQYLNFSNYCLNVAGDGQAMAECKKLVKSLGLSNKVNFLSWVINQNKIELLAKSDIYVLPSYFEGYPNSLIEAMASNCAVIATDVGSIPDLLHHMQNGLIFKPGDIVTLASHLDLLVSNARFRSKLAQNGRESILLNNSINSVVDKFKVILN